MNTVRLRKCDSGLDEKIRAEIVARILPLSPGTARVVHEHFEKISTAFVILFFLSTVYSFIGIYNFLAYGNCNGPQGGYCILSDLAGTGRIGTSPNSLSLPENPNGQVFGNANMNYVVYEYGCYSCPYTANAEPIVQRLYQEYGSKVEFVYKTVPIAAHNYSTEAASASWCAYEQGAERYTMYRVLLFERQQEWRSAGNSTLMAMAGEAGLDRAKFATCFNSGEYIHEIARESKEGSDIGIYGTPTFFIGNKSFVGSVTYEELKGAIDSMLADSAKRIGAGS